MVAPEGATDPNHVTLTFHGPFGLAGQNTPILFSDPIARQAGLYLWTVGYVGGGVLVSYVGETGTMFGRRMKEHAIQVLGGNYRISDPEQLRHGQDRVLWNGLWRAGTRDKLPEYVDRFLALAPAAKKYLEAQQIFVAPCHAGMRVRRRIEAGIARSIWEQPSSVSTLLPRDIRYQPRRANESPIAVAIVTPITVLGLPTRLEA